MFHPLDRTQRKIVSDLVRQASLSGVDHVAGIAPHTGSPPLHDKWSKKWIPWERRLRCASSVLFGALVFFASTLVIGIVTFGVFPTALFMVSGSTGPAHPLFLEQAGRLSVIGVAALLFRLSAERSLREEMKIYIPSHDRTIVGSFGIELAESALIFGVPCGVVFGGCVLQHGGHSFDCILASFAMALASTLSMVASNELVRRWVPWGELIRSFCFLAAIFVTLLLVADAIDPPNRRVDIVNFASVWMSTAQCFPCTGWFLSAYLYATNQIPYFPIGSVIGVGMITTALWLTRNGFMIRGFQWNRHANRIAVERLDHAAGGYSGQNGRSSLRANSLQQHRKTATESLSKTLSLLCAYGLSSTMDRSNHRFNPNVVVEMFNAKGTNFWSWILAASFSLWSGYLLILSQSQWLGSLSIVYHAVWMILAGMLTMQGNHMASAQHMSFLQSYLPIRLLDHLSQSFLGNRRWWLRFVLPAASTGCLIYAGMPVWVALYLFSTCVALSILHSAFIHLPFGYRTNDIRSWWAITTTIVFVVGCISATASVSVMRTEPLSGLMSLWTSVFLSCGTAVVAEWLMHSGWVDRQG